jgi:hypothetical protein
MGLFLAGAASIMTVTSKAVSSRIVPNISLSYWTVPSRAASGMIDLYGSILQIKSDQNIFIPIKSLRHNENRTHG